jgi:hypothetical protein
LNIITGFSHRLGKKLLLWSISSLIVGVLLYLLSEPLIQGIGLQAIFWGIIDAVIALFTLFKQRDEQIEKMAKILRINIGLDIVYQVIGVLLLVFLWEDAFIAGNGIGVIIQGAFLFVLDLYYFLRIRIVSIIEVT